ncbi:MAG: glycosyltransferase family 2 protein [Candidatus Sericytochromatia bacterium]
MFLLSVFIVLLSFIIMLVSFINLLTKPILKKNINNNQKIKISVLIPARNEEKNIFKLLDSLKNQIYNNIEIIVLDDNSEDDTYNIVNNFCVSDERFKLIKGEQLPDNWLGKNWACHQLSKSSSGKYLIFLDADTTLYPEFIDSIVNYMENKDIKLLSLFPQQITLSLGEKIIVPFIYHILLSLLILHLVKIPYFSSLSAANGQCMIFDAENYKENNWHKKVKSSLAEDIIIIKTMKKSKYKVSALLGNNLIKCRMYNNLSDCISGFEKNIILIFGNFFILFFYIFFILLGFVFTTNIFHLQLIALFTIVSKVCTSKIRDQNILLDIMLYPFQIFFIILISVRTVYKKILKKEILWKGRKLNIS